MKYQNFTAAQRVALARHPQRPVAREYIDAMIEDFFPLYGDRLHGEDASILGGVGLFQGRPVTVIAQQKGRSLEENIACRFGYGQSGRLSESGQIDETGGEVSQAGDYLRGYAGGISRRRSGSGRSR